MPDADTTDPKKVDKVTGKEYEAKASPLMSKKGLIIVAGILVVEALLVVLVMGLVAPRSEADKDAESEMATGPIFPQQYKLGSSKATVRYGKGSKRVLVDEVCMTIDAGKAPGVGEALADATKKENIEIPVRDLVANILASYDYEDLSKPSAKSKIEWSLKKKIEERLGLEEGAVTSVTLLGFQLPK